MAQADGRHEMRDGTHGRHGAGTDVDGRHEMRDGTHGCHGTGIDEDDRHEGMTDEHRRTLNSCIWYMKLVPGQMPILLLHVLTIFIYLAGLGRLFANMLEMVKINTRVMVRN